MDAGGDGEVHINIIIIFNTGIIVYLDNVYYNIWHNNLFLF